MVVTVLTVSHALAQCGVVQPCHNQKFPYRFCPLINGKTEEVCTDDPLNVPGKRAARNVLPLCARVVTSPSDPTEVKMKDVNGVDVVVYSPSQLQADVDAAIAAWNCLCGFTQHNMLISSTCCTEIRWTKNPADFRNVTSGTFILGQQQSSMTSSPAEFCGEYGCYLEGSNRVPSGPEHRMFLNNTDDFRAAVSSGPSISRMLYSGTTLPTGVGGAGLNNRTQVWSLRDVITHEIGHWAGLLHPDADNPPNFTLRCDPIGAPSTGLMTSNLASDKPPKGLSDQDKCQFMRLYCPTITSVHEEVRHFVAERTTAAIVVRDHYTWNAGPCEKNVLRAWNLNGEELPIPHFRSDVNGFVTIFCSELPKGVIVLSMTCLSDHLTRFTMLLVE